MSDQDSNDNEQTSAVCIRLPYGVSRIENLDYQYPKTPLDNAGVEERQKKCDQTSQVCTNNNQEAISRQKEEKMNMLNIIKLAQIEKQENFASEELWTSEKY